MSHHIVKPMWMNTTYVAVRIESSAEVMTTYMQVVLLQGINLHVFMPDLKYIYSMIVMSSAVPARLVGGDTEILPRWPHQGLL